MKILDNNRIQSKGATITWTKLPGKNDDYRVRVTYNSKVIEHDMTIVKPCLLMFDTVDRQFYTAKIKNLAEGSEVVLVDFIE